MNRGRRAALGPRHEPREQGSTLTELMVVMFVMGVITIALATLVIGFQKTSAQNVARQDQIEAARAGVERIAKTVRTAVKPSRLTAQCNVAFCELDAFMLAAPTSVQFYGNLDNPLNSVGPSRVSYAVSGAGELVEKVQRPMSATPLASGYDYCDPTAVSATTACRNSVTTQVLARGVKTGAALFTYYDTSGAPLTPNASGGLSADDLEQVLSIELTLQVQTELAQAAPTTYIQRLTLPNTQAVIRQGTVTP